MTQELSRIIEEIKKVESLTQYEVAERLGYDHTYLSQLLNGKKPASKKLLEKVKLTFPSASKIIDNKSTENTNQAGTKKPESLQVLTDTSKIDTVLTLVLQLSAATQHNSSELQVLNHKLTGLEQMMTANAAIQEEYQRFLVRKLDVGTDVDKTVEELQQIAFEKILGRQIKGKNHNQNSHTMHK